MNIDDHQRTKEAIEEMYDSIDPSTPISWMIHESFVPVLISIFFVEGWSINRLRRNMTGPDEDGMMTLRWKG